MQLKLTQCFLEKLLRLSTFTVLPLIVNLILHCGTFADCLIFVVLRLLKVHFLFNSTVSPAIDILANHFSSSKQGWHGFSFQTRLVTSCELLE